MYVERASHQYVKPSVAVLDRGSIFFSGKDDTKVLAATLKSGFKIFMNPMLIADPKSSYEALTQYITLDKKEFTAKATKPNDHYEELADQVPDAAATSIRNLGVAGLGVSKETWRTYPGNSLAAHELGLLGEDAAQRLRVNVGQLPAGDVAAVVGVAAGVGELDAAPAEVVELVEPADGSETHPVVELADLLQRPRRVLRDEQHAGVVGEHDHTAAPCDALARELREISAVARERLAVDVNPVRVSWREVF